MSLAPSGRAMRSTGGPGCIPSGPGRSYRATERREVVALIYCLRSLSLFLRKRG